MKQLTFLTLLILTTAAGMAQPEIEWQCVLGGNGNEVAYDMIRTTDNGLLLVGYTTSSITDGGDVKHAGRGGKDYWIVKLSNAPADQKPVIEWERNYGGARQDVAFKAIQDTATGRYFIIGKTNSGKTGDLRFEAIGGFDYWMIELDADGELIRDTLFGGVYNDDYGPTNNDTDTLGTFSRCNIIRTRDGNHLVFVGDIWLNNQRNTSDVWWLKMNWQTWQVEGNEHFDWDGPNNLDYESIARGIAETADGNFVISANIGIAGLRDQFWMFRINEDGTLISPGNQHLGGSGDDIPSGTMVDQQGNILIVGRGNSDNGIFTDHHINHDGIGPSINDAKFVKTDNLLQVIWAKSYGSNHDDQAWDVIQSGSGDYYICGFSQPLSARGWGDVCTAYGNGDFFLMKVNEEDGSLEWTKSVGSGGGDNAFTVALRNDRPVIAGFTDTGNFDVDPLQFHDSLDVWVVQFKETSCPALPEPAIRKTMTEDSIRFEVTNVPPNNYPNLSFQWFGARTDTFTRVAWLMLSATDPNEYTVRFSLDCCFSVLSDTFTIDYVPVPGSAFVFHDHPVITPNGDGKNDLLVFDGLPAENELTVYNRWGEQIFDARPYGNDWDGTWKGDLLPEADYYFRLRFPKENRTYTGFVWIIY